MEAPKLAADAGAPAGSAEPGSHATAVDVVIVSADMAEMTLECVQCCAGEPVASVVVVDNAFDSAAGSRRELLARRSTVVSLPSAHGFAAANNRGIAVGSAPYVLLLNSDVLAQPGSIVALVRALEHDPRAVAAGGRLVDPHTLATQEGYRPRTFPTLASLLVVVLGIEERWPRNPVTRRYHGAGVAERGVQEVEQPAAAALLVRRSELDAVGGLDERFWFWFEDSDLLRRLSVRGRILYVPDASFRHLGGGSFARWDKVQHIRSVHHGMLRYAHTHFSPARRSVLGAALLAASAPRAALFSRTRPQEARAWRDVARGAAALALGKEPPAIAPGP